MREDGARDGLVEGVPRQGWRKCQGEVASTRGGVLAYLADKGGVS